MKKSDSNNSMLLMAGLFSLVVRCLRPLKVSTYTQTQTWFVETYPISLFSQTRSQTPSRSSVRGVTSLKCDQMGDLSLFGRLLNNVLAKMDHFGQFLKRIQFSSENCLGNFLTQFCNFYSNLLVTLLPCTIAYNYSTKGWTSLKMTLTRLNSRLAQLLGSWWKQRGRFLLKLKF